MSITLDPRRPSLDQISPLRIGRFATPEEKAAMEAAKAEENESQDKIEISQEGQDAVSEAPPQGSDMTLTRDEIMDRVDTWLSSMTKEEFDDLVREQLGEPKQLKINWNAVVDPDHMIYTKTYMDSMCSQLKEVEGVIKDYYSEPYQEALRDPDPLMFLAAKYKCSWCNRYDGSLPDNERQWLYDQVRRMITGVPVSLADPYALAGTGLNQGSSVDRIAEKAATEKIEELIRQAKADAGIVEQTQSKTGAARL